jgi:hypothetical protein
VEHGRPVAARAGLTFEQLDQGALLHRSDPQRVRVKRHRAASDSCSCDRLRHLHRIQTFVDDRVNEAVDAMLAEPGCVP